ncbi:MAG: hypothetical protein KAR37_07155 [Alphaproteobacteria bacterium]|nr:hypothetical protein [Alphaproteobacteria bacterium]
MADGNDDAISGPVAEALGVPPSSIQWLSPLPGDGFAEYRDEAFLGRLDVDLPKRPLAEFWPRRGPVWDGLGRSERGDLLLVEAKAHIGEMVSPPSQAGDESRKRIEAALDEVRDYLRIKNDADWTDRFYQYTNRLAHLYLLRVVNQLPAWLVFVHFVNDGDMGGPATREKWEGAIKVMRAVLGLRERHRLSKYVIDLFPDVRTLAGP